MIEPPAPILVTGAHRTGTTWVGKMLAASGQAAYISEPLNHLHRPGVMRLSSPFWYMYLCTDNEETYLPALREMLRFKYHSGRELLSLRSLKDAGRMGRDWSIFLRGRVFHLRPLLKDPFAVFSAPWFASRLNCRVVITVRHPAAFASSLKRLNWPFDFADLLEQPLLMRDWLEPFRDQMETLRQGFSPTSEYPEAATSNSTQENTGSAHHSGAVPADTTPSGDTPSGDNILAQGSLLWNMVYAVVDRWRRPEAAWPSHSLAPPIVVRHEDLSLAPVEGFRALYQLLGLDFTPKAEQTIRLSSSSENPRELAQRKVHSVHLDSAANLHNWKRRLSQAEIDQVRSLTEATAALYYPDQDWG